MEEIPGSMGSSCGLFSGKSGIAHHLFLSLLLPVFLLILYLNWQFGFIFVVHSFNEPEEVINF